MYLKVNLKAAMSTEAAMSTRGEHNLRPRRAASEAEGVVKTGEVEVGSWMSMALCTVHIGTLIL